MKKEMQETIQRALKEYDRALLAIKIRGGYKCKELLQNETGWPNQKIAPYIDKSERRLQETVISLIVAETMLSELPPSLPSRWVEYMSRREDVLAELRKK